MIRFTNPSIEKDVLWGEDNRVNEIVIENPEFYRNIVRQLTRNNDESDIKFIYTSDRAEPRPLTISTEVDVLCNPYSLEFNSRQVVSALLKLVAVSSNSEEFYLSTNKFKTKIVKYINELVDAENFGFEVSSDEFTIDQIAKAINLHIVDDEDDYVELLTDYMEVMTELGKTKVFVLINFQSFISSIELNRLMKNAASHDFNILLLENMVHNKASKLPRIIVDNDLCEI